MTDKIQVLIVDDHTIVRGGLRLLLETADHIEVVGEAENGRVALTLAADLQPDLILMDLRMPEMDGLTAIGHLQAEQPHIAIIILTTYNEDDLMLRGLQAGARGYLLKDMSRGSLLDTIEAAVRGDTLLKPDILQRALAAQRPSTPPPTSAAETNLTERELEVLRIAAEGETNKGIGLRLGITPRTAKAHLTSVYNKLGVDSRAAAIAVAAQKGWL
ncbi:MAG: response regulator transcription factor [Chloroflexota bacterium]